MSLTTALRRAIGHRPGPWLVAYSGGCDSSALLHATAQLGAECGVDVRAVHIDHGLQSAAADFVRHCEQTCTALGVALTVRQARVAIAAGDSIEEQARAARYACLRELATQPCVILFAHHRADQAETLLLQLLRGAGVAGTAAMPVERAIGAGVLVRPWLDCTTDDIAAYVREHQLTSIDDPTNADTNLKRNAVRAELLPLIKTLWPGAERTLARAAGHHAHAHRLLRERADEDGATAATLPLAQLRALSADRRDNLLRFWLAAHAVRAPSTRSLRALWQAVDTARADRQPMLRCGERTVIAWHGQLHCVAAPDTMPAERYMWPAGEACFLPPTGQTLRWEELCAQYAGQPGAQVEVRFRAGGERCHLPGRTHSHALKKLLQAAHIPPWQRSRIPLIYEHGQLRLVWGHFACDKAA